MIIDNYGRLGNVEDHLVVRFIHACVVIWFQYKEKLEALRIK